MSINHWIQITHTNCEYFLIQELLQIKMIIAIENSAFILKESKLHHFDFLYTNFFLENQNGWRFKNFPKSYIRYNKLSLT